MAELSSNGKAPETTSEAYGIINNIVNELAKDDKLKADLDEMLEAMKQKQDDAEDEGEVGKLELNRRKDAEKRKNEFVIKDIFFENVDPFEKIIQKLNEPNYTNLKLLLSDLLSHRVGGKKRRSIKKKRQPKKNITIKKKYKKKNKKIPKKKIKKKHTVHKKRRKNKNKTLRRRK